MPPIDLSFAGFKREERERERERDEFRTAPAQRQCELRRDGRSRALLVTTHNGSPSTQKNLA